MVKRKQPLRHKRVQRRAIVAAHLGAAAVRLVQAAQRLRRLRSATFLFQRVISSRIRGFGWIPRPWHLRRGCLFGWMVDNVIRIHRGRRWRRLGVQRWGVGFAAGAFARTMTAAVFKKKASAKKRRKRQQQHAPQAFDWKIQRIRDVKAGVRRRTSVHHDVALDTQLRTFI